MDMELLQLSDELVVQFQAKPFEARLSWVRRWVHVANMA